MVNSVCLFGDSIIKGVVFDDIRGRYTLLKNSFTNLVGQSTGIIMKNFAKFGCTITSGEKIINRHESELTKNKYVGLGFGGNDCDFDWSAISECPHGEHKAKTAITDFEILYSKIIDKIRIKESHPILFSLPPLNAQKYFNWVSRGLNAENILRWLGDVEHIYRWHEMYNLAVMKLASAKQVALIDIRKAFLESKNYLKFYCQDGIHPNEAGHALIAGVTKNFMLKNKGLAMA